MGGIWGADIEGWRRRKERRILEGKIGMSLVVEMPLLGVNLLSSLHWDTRRRGRGPRAKFKANGCLSFIALQKSLLLTTEAQDCTLL